MELFRKHKKAIYWLIIGLVGIPFIFIGTGFMPFSSGGGAGMLGGTEPVATVAGLPIQADELHDALNRQNPSNPGAEGPDNQTLLETGKVDDALNNLVKSRLVESEANAVQLTYDRDFLADTLKKDPSFQNEQGQVDPEKWNSFVREQRDMGANWDAIYASVQDSINRRIMAQRVLSSARVRPQELRDQFERDNTKYTLKYVAVEPKIEPTEEQIQAHYEANKTNYEIPAQRKAEFIVIPTGVPRPAQLDDFVKQAREGKDFESIAQGAPENLNAMGRPAATWIPEDQLPPDLSVLLTMQAGEVSEPIETPAGYIICRIEEARVVPETAKRELRVSMISIAPQLTPEEREAQDAQVAAIAAAAKDGDLAAAAAQAGVPVQTTDSFSVQSTAIQGVSEEDTIVFAQGLAKVEQGQVSEPVRGRENTYIAKVVELIPAVPQPLDTVRDRVVADTVAALKMEAEYKTNQEQIAAEIAQKATTIDDARTQFPDALGEVKQVGPITVK
ncbi:MAG: peptidylprolyl isomerase, partial [FCB group bacterium]|nr:peptidylprolyl isomerase [FCB group bacterium]